MCLGPPHYFLKNLSHDEPYDIVKLACKLMVEIQFCVVPFNALLFTTTRDWCEKVVIVRIRFL